MARQNIRLIAISKSNEHNDSSKDCLLSGYTIYKCQMLDIHVRMCIRMKVENRVQHHHHHHQLAS